MSNSDTVKAITDNVQSVLEAQGVKFNRKVFDKIDDIPASITPYGKIFDINEEFEDLYGQRPSYSELRFLIAVLFRGRDETDLMRKIQEWRSKIREALTVNALNIGELASSKLVSLVTHGETEKDSDFETNNVISVLNYNVSVRYRES